MNESDYPRATTPVVFISGAARSGSTLLGEMLGAHPKVLDVGELALFWRDAARGNPCSCGEPIPDCEFWGDILSTLRDTLGLERREFDTLARTRATLSRTTRYRRLRRLRRDPDAMTQAERRLVNATSELIRQAHAKAGTAVTVDASKTLPSLLLHGLGSESDVTCVHLVRDPRAVAASVVRSRGTERGNRESLPPGGNAMTAVVRWTWMNVFGWLSRFSARRYMRVHYERMVDSPSAVCAEICSMAGIEFDQHSIQGSTVYLVNAMHVPVGNPGRGQTVIQLAPDRRWENELSRSQQYLVVAFTWPLYALLRIGCRRPVR